MNYPRVDKVMVRGVKRLFINPNSELLGDLINKLVRSMFDSEYPKVTIIVSDQGHLF